MDYIIFGTGAGSSLVLIGWLLRDWGPALRDRRSRPDGEILTALQLVDQMRWARFCGSCGTALAIGGMVVLLATMIALVMNPSDARGGTIVLAAFATVVVGMIAWSWLFVRRFGVAGIVRRRSDPVVAEASPFDEDAHDDAESPDETTMAEPRAQEPAPERDISVAKPIPAPAAAQEQRVKTVIGDEEDGANAGETGAGDMVEPEDAPTDPDRDDERPASPADLATEVRASADAGLAVDANVDGGPVDVTSDDQEIGEADGDNAGNAAGSSPATESPADPDSHADPDGDTAERAGGREEALRNLRQRRLGRLSRNRP